MIAHWEVEPGRRLNWMTSNLAILRSESNGTFMLFGGLSQADVTTPGVVFAQGSSHHFSVPGSAPMQLPGSGDAPGYCAQRSQWRAVRTLFDGLVARIYHCDDGWCELTCKSWFVDLF